MAWQTSTSYTLANLDANTQYWLKVRAKNGDNVSTDYSAASSDVTPPAAPTSLETSNICRTTASISWVAATGADTYTFSYGTDTAGTNLGTTSDIVTTQKSLTGLTNLTTYYYKIRSTSSTNGAGAYSSVASFATASCTAPTAPADFAGTVVSASQINWSWSDTADDETAWQVKDSGGSNLSDALAANSTSWNETGLLANTVYSRKTSASNAYGSNNSNIISLYTLAAVPAAPTLVANSTNSIKIVINANGNPDATRYSIYNQTLGKYVKNADGGLQDDVDWQLYADWGGTDGFVNIGLVAGTNYVYKVKAENGDNITTAFSTTADINTSNPTIQLSSTSASGAISTSSVTVPITISEVSGTDISVDYAVSGGTATPETDFTLASGTASISHGDTSTSFSIAVTNNHLVGPNKTIVVTLSNPIHSSLGSELSYTYTIVNDNPAPSGSFVLNSDETRTGNQTVSLALSYDLATQVKISTASNFADASYQDVASTINYILPATDGAITVYLKYKDQYGNESATYSHSIVLDLTAPATPSSASTVSGNAAISLSWTNPTDVDFATIKIYRDTTSGFTPYVGNLIKTTDSTTAATFTDASVSNNTNYYYKFTALDDLGNESAASGEVTGRPDSDKPTTPGKPSLATKIDATDTRELTNSKQVTLNWSPAVDTNSGIKSYYLSIGTISGSSNVLQDQVVNGNTSSYNYEFSSDGTYYVRVYSSDNKNNLSATSSETTLIIDTTAPTAPTNVTMADVSNRADNYYAVILTWKPATDAGSGLKGYVVSRTGQSINLDSAGVTTNISTDAKSGLVSYLDVLSADAKASYTIKAIDNAKNETAAISATLSENNMTKTTGQKVGSTEIILPSSIIGEGELVISDIKASSSATTNDTTQAEITWLTSVPANSQVMYGSSSSYSLKTDIDTGLNSSHTVILSDLKPATTYHYKVFSIDQHSNTVFSGDQTFTTSGQIKQKTVLEIIADYVSGFFNNIYNAIKKVFSLKPDTAIAAAVAGPKSIYVTNVSTPSQPGYAIYWPNNLNKVTLERSENGSAFTSVVQTERNFYSDTDVKADSTYTYRVGNLTASVSDAMSGKSIISNIKIEAGIVDKDSASVIVTFKTDKLAQSQILYGANGVMDNKTALDKSLNQTHTVLIKKLKVNTAYSFTLRAIDSSGANTTDSPIQKFVTPKAPIDMSLFEIIINALESAFAGLGKIGK